MSDPARLAPDAAAGPNSVTSPGVLSPRPKHGGARQRRLPRERRPPKRCRPQPAGTARTGHSPIISRPGGNVIATEPDHSMIPAIAGAADRSNRTAGPEPMMLIAVRIDCCWSEWAGADIGALTLPHGCRPCATRFEERRTGQPRQRHRPAPWTVSRHPQVFVQPTSRRPRPGCMRSD